MKDQKKIPRLKHGGKNDEKYRKECKRHGKKYAKILNYKYQ